jgi:two-component system response regulator FixJ
MSVDPVVFVVDEDSSSRESVCRMLRSLGVRAAAPTTLDDCLEGYRDQPSCLIANLATRTASGVDVQEELRRRGTPIPLVALVRQPKASEVVRALRGGAVTVLDAPVDADELRTAVQEGLALDAERRRRREELAVVRQRLASLSDKERDVLRMIVAGRPNKAMANHLGASLRTIENRRREVFSKLKVRSVAELVTLALRAEDGADL